MEGGPPCFPQGSTCPVVLKVAPGAPSLSPTGLSPSTAARSRVLRLGRRFLTPWGPWGAPWCALQPRRGIGPQPTKPRRFGLLPVRSPLLGESRLLSFPPGTKMFQFPEFPPRLSGASRVHREGFPHWGIPGYACLAAHRGLSRPCHALLRPLAPRHPPWALSSLTPIGP